MDLSSSARRSSVHERDDTSCSVRRARQKRMSASRTLAGALAVSAGTIRAAGADAGACDLKDVFLRSLADANGNAMPIDVYPVPGDHMKFWALMDYSMSGFQLEVSASPSSHCTASLTGPPTVMVDAGSNVVTEVSVRDSITGMPVLYHVNVSRLSGKETALMSVQIQDAELVPAWSPAAWEYSAYLSVAQDLIKVAYQALDNGQLVSLVASPEAIRTADSSGVTRRLGSGADAAVQVAAALASLPSGATTGLGPPIGEVQRSPSTVLSSIDAGRDRLVELLVKSADNSEQKSYKFSVQRPNCPVEQRFFDGRAKVCTDICNEGYFGNHATGRCTQCLVDGCLVCPESGIGCSMCVDGLAVSADTCVSAPGGLAQVGELESDVQKFQAEHRVLSLAALCSAVVSFCVCVLFYCSSRGSGGFSGARMQRFIESDDDDELTTLREHYGD